MQTLTDALEAMARAELDEAATVSAITRTVEALTPHLDAERRDLWWRELKHCLARTDDAECGPAWDEIGIDWADRVAEALGVLAGHE